MNRTHSHLYSWSNENPSEEAYNFVEANRFSEWEEENGANGDNPELILIADENNEKYYIWLEDITKGWFTIYKVNHSLTDYESDCPFCTGHFQE